MSPRKKSPRAPSIALDEAIERVTKVYEKERRHAAPLDVVAQDMGYKNANNGKALSTLASLRYYGLLERPKDGHLAVTKEFESYNFAPNDGMRISILQQWIRNPPVFSELLEKYSSGLPSDATIRFDLIQDGFSPATAESVIAVFKQSAAFADAFEHQEASRTDDLDGGFESVVEAEESSRQVQPPTATRSPQAAPIAADGGAQVRSADPSSDQIPVRLSMGRKAWLVIPQPFYEADKARLKAQIDLLLTEDDEED